MLPNLFNVFSTISFEKLLSNLNCSIDMFKNIESETLRAVELQKRNQEQESIKDFYKDAQRPQGWLHRR